MQDSLYYYRPLPQPPTRDELAEQILDTVLRKHRILVHIHTPQKSFLFKTITAAQKRTIITDYRDHEMSATAIGQKHNFSTSLVVKVLQEAGVRRNAYEATQLRLKHHHFNYNRSLVL